MTDIKRSTSQFFSPRRISAPVAAARFPGTDIVLLDSADAVTPYLDALDELAASATDSNPLFEGAALQAAMQYLVPAGAVHVALIWGDAGPDGKRALIGTFPYQVRRFYLGLPMTVWSIWTHIHSFLATPLVRAGQERMAIRHFFAHADRCGAPLIRFPLLEAGGAFDTALSDILAERGLPHVETGRHDRAFLKSDLDGEAYLAAHMRKKKRKEYNRLWNRLAETGALDFATHGGGADFNGWLDEFLRLESAGWKGKRGTALAERPEERAFFESMAGRARAEAKLHCAEIRLDGKPVAMLASFLSGGGAYSFKIAHDEAYAKYSPGALLMMKVIGAFLSDPRIGWVDSCAIPNHPMIDHIWAERRGIREVNVATSHRLSASLVAYTARASRLADYAWAKARAVYYRIRKEVEHEQAH